jgi:hypothetical protein
MVGKAGASRDREHSGFAPGAMEETDDAQIAGSHLPGFSSGARARPDRTGGAGHGRRLFVCKGDRRPTIRRPLEKGGQGPFGRKAFVGASF